MSSLRTRFPLAVSFATVCLMGSSAVFASDTPSERGGEIAASEVACAAQAWPNVSAECAGSKTLRKVRVISLDKESPTIVPVPASVQAAYASKVGDAKDGVARNSKPNDDLAQGLPMPKLADEGTAIAVDSAKQRAVVATTSDDRKAAAARRQERAKKVAKVQRQAKERYASGTVDAPYVGNYGYETPRPMWRDSRAEQASGGWFGGF